MTATKEELPTNILTKEELPTIGTLEGGFDRRAFGHARFGESYGRNRSSSKEARPTNTLTKEAVNSM